MKSRPKFVDTKKMTIEELIFFRRASYNKIKSIKCPFMNEVVFFNNKGFFHTTHDGRGKIRSELDQRMRLNLLTDIKDVVRNAKQFGEPPRIISKNDKTNREKKDIVFYELFHRFHSRKAVSVILRRIGNGQLHYYSVRYSKKAKITKKNP
jgi:hypothetical protein